MHHLDRLILWLARELVNTGNMCSINAALRLLVHIFPFWNLSRKLGNSERQRGAGVPETGGGRIPLVDSPARFMEEFMFTVRYRLHRCSLPQAECRVEVKRKRKRTSLRII